MSGIDLQGETEQSLIAALRQGKRAELGILYDAYAPILMGVISRIVKDTELAEEVLKDTFVNVWTKAGTYGASKERLLTWVLGIARQIALDVIKTDRYISIITQSANTTKSYTQPNKPVTLSHGQLQVQERCNLSTIEKRSLELLYLKGYTCTETASELNLTVPELKAVLKKAFTQLKVEKSS